jgi:hypothetical protein
MIPRLFVHFNGFVNPPLLLQILGIGVVRCSELDSTVFFTELNRLLPLLTDLQNF